MRRPLPEGTVTFVFTDVEGSTRLLHEVGADAYAEQLAAHRRIVRAACAAEGGVEVDTQGDAFFLSFASAPAAVEAARAMTERLRSGPVKVRIGIHTGTPLRTSEGYVGEDVHLGARVAASAHGGQIVLSHATRALLDGVDPIVELGEHRLKDIPFPVGIYQLGTARFPPLKTLSNTNLPSPASSFVGRDRELPEVLERIRSGARLVTLTGAGGSGKTRLALAVATTLVPSFRAGVLWLSLASVTEPALVTESIAKTLGATGDLAEHIGEREMLLLLDNLEQVLDVAPRLADLLEQCPQLTLLVTSRSLLRVRGEVEYEVPPLAETEAVDLFRERAGTPATEDVVELCRRLDHLPLAVELAAARATALTPAQILERLSGRPDLLKGGRDANPRQSTLRATMEWSHDLLHPDERELFRRVAIFDGGWTLDAAEELCEAHLDTLQSLVEHSLVRFSEGRYWMLQTIAEYARERLSDSPLAANLQAGHAEFYARLVHQAEPELEGARQDEWLDTLEEEHDNIRAALRTLLDARRTDDALGLSGSLATFWWIRGHWSEGRRWLDEALSQPRPHDSAARAKALEGAAHLAYRQLDYDLAGSLIGEALDIARRHGPTERLSRALRVSSLVASGRGDTERFRALIEESAAAARAAGDGWTLAMALNNLGCVALEACDFADAERLLHEALELVRERGDARTEAFVLQNVGFAHLEQRELEPAHRSLSASLLLARRLGFQEIVVEDLIGMAAVAAAYREFQRAAVLLGGAERLRMDMKAGHDRVEERVRRRTQDELEQALGPAAVEDGFRSGFTQHHDTVVELALREPAPTK